MKSLEEYKKEIEQDPKARRRLKKLEKEFEAVEESLTDEELIKYGLKPAETQESQESQESQAVQESQEVQETQDTDNNDPAANAVLDSIARKLW